MEVQELQQWCTEHIRAAFEAARDLQLSADEVRCLRDAAEAVVGNVDVDDDEDAVWRTLRVSATAGDVLARIDQLMEEENAAAVNAGNNPEVQDARLQVRRAAAEEWKRSGDALYTKWLSLVGTAARTKAPSSLQGKDGQERARTQLLERALKAYSEGICSASQSEVDGLLYANRAAVLLQLGYYELAIADCDRALQAGYPEEKTFKLLQRRGNCWLHLGEPALAIADLKKAQELVEELVDCNLASVKAELAKDMAKAENSVKKRKPVQQSSKQTQAMLEAEISCASSAIEVNRSEEAGRCIISTRDLKAGEAVVHEEPYAAVLLRKYESTHCHQCFSALLAPIPCTDCTRSRYCLEECRSNATAVHKYECGQVFFEVAPTLLVLCMRILQQRWNGISQDRSMKNYDVVYSLLPHGYDLPVEVIEEYAQWCIVSYLYTKRRRACRLLTEQQPRISETGLPHITEEWMNLQRLFRHLCQTHTNVYAIFEIDSTGEAVQQRRVAEAIYPMCSLFNHSCAPNTVLNYEGRMLTLRVTEDVPMGKQIFNCYGPHVAHMPSREERRRALRKQYFFTCTCEGCSRGSNDFDYIICGAEGCTRELVIDPEGIKRGNCVIRCSCGQEVDIRVVQKNVKLAREFFNHARAALDSPTPDLDRAVQALNHALRLRSRYLHPLHRELGRTHDALAEGYARQSRFKEAAQHLEHAIAALEAVFPAFSFELAEQYFKMTQICFNARGNPTTTESWAVKAEHVWSTLIGAAPSCSSTSSESPTHRGSQVKRGRNMLDELRQIREELKAQK